jgi:predicted nucleic acid-binding protein
LSDRFDRPEQLEALFLIACTRVRPEERLEDLREQLQERWAAFPKNYPASRLIQSVPIDTSSPEGIDAFFHEHVRPGAEQVQNLSEQVVRGEMAIAPLAAVAGRAVSLITLQLGRAMPLGFHDTVLERLERESAAQSVTRAVVWDPVALAIVASLPHEISELIRLAFPASLTAQATLDDLRRASDRPASDQDEASTLGFNPVSGEGFVRRRPAEEVTRETDAVTRAIEIAQTLQIKPDVDPAKHTEMDQFLSEEDRDASFVTWPATLALAEREQKPIFSDDRYVRAQARRSGLVAFGTLAALDALAARALISEEQRRLARSLLRREGAIGVGATLDELLAEGREANWSLTPPGVAFALLDPTSWAQNTVETYQIWSALLRTVFDERPDEFENWVWRFLDAANRNLPGRSPGFYAETLLLIAWQPYDPPDQAFFEALVAALRNGRNVFGWYDDSLLGASRRMLELSRTEDGKLRASLLRVVLAVLGFREQLALLGLDLNQR